MSYLEQYRPPGRSNRSGRTNADNDVFEGLPVKQWGQQYARVSLAPPVSETQPGQDDKWGEPPMPRDYQLLNTWTQHLLRLARSGKVGTKRKQETDAIDDDRPEDEVAEDVNAKTNLDERVYVAKKWKPVPDHMLVQEHKHFEFLAKRRRGLSSLYAPDQQNGAVVAMRKTKVQRADVSGETVLYEVLVPEGQHVEGEVPESIELPDAKPVTAAPGTVIEGVGIANEEGVLVAEHLKPAVVPRRNRPPPKKKGGPGRGKKRVTFTNPDGSTYTTIVPNATKIVPQPGQVVKHVAKGEEAGADVTVEEAARRQQQHPGEGEEGSGSDEGDDEDDDREVGEVSDEDAPGTGTVTPAKPTTPAKTPSSAPPAEVGESQPMEDVRPTGEAIQEHQELSEAAAATMAKEPEPELEPETKVEKTSQPPPEVVPAAEVRAPKDASSSPEVALATSHSRSASLAEPPAVSLDEARLEANAKNAEDPPEAAEDSAVAQAADSASAETAEKPAPAPAPAVEVSETIKDEAPETVEDKQEQPPEPETAKSEDADEDLLGNLEKHLGA
ncbi:Hypothetical predicted protein [Lecanosticta acicola]|uniref:Uncharacterized protein n=1 Tax=Lecanosticta acicola TaxID=111012 RepID=A0AAI8W1U6_9PEZI|nr:Hypothetical predicted protein [Lecanosticta acicola]